MRFFQTQLDNGLEVVAECNPRAYSTALGFFVKAGAQDEPQELAGVSHFLEHMAFKGTAARTAADVNRQFDEIGAYTNAYTSVSKTVYYAAVLPELLPRALEILADILRPALREEDFETEKRVILEEILSDDDEPPFGALERCMAAYFGEHPLGRRVLGCRESIEALTPQAMRRYFQRHYCPENIVLAATGNVDFAALRALADRHCGHWATGNGAAPSARTLPPFDRPDRCTFEVVRKSSAAREYAVLISAAPPSESDDRFAARILATILGGDGSSRLYWELLHTGLAEDVETSLRSYEGAGVFTTYLGCDPSDAAENLRRIRAVQRDVECHGISANELELAKNQLASRNVLASERPVNRLFTVGNHWISRRQYLTVRETVDQYLAVSRDQIAALLDQYPLSINTTVAVGPLEDVPFPD